MTNREIDVLVAEKVMGFGIVREKRVNGNIYISTKQPILEDLPHYSTNISDAWQVLGKFIKAEVEKWDNEFYVANLHVLEQINGEVKTFSENALTAPMAICKTALKAKGVEVK